MFGEIRDDAMDLEAGIVGNEGARAVAQSLFADIEWDIPTQRPSRLHRIEQGARLPRRSGADLDQLRELGSVDQLWRDRLEDPELGSGLVVLRQAGDRL